jgi:precorrin isomerase
MVGAVHLHFEYFRRFMTVKGRVENIILIFDCKDFSYFKANPSQTKAILSIIQAQYKCSTRAIFVLNAPTALHMLYTALTYVLDEKVIKKI